jgi:hypothetical protein
VHGHWLLARLLRRAPGMPSRDAICAWLDQAFTDANVAGELAFLARPESGGFERPYGWAWLLMLQAELQARDDVAGRSWANAIEPLGRAIERRLLAWLPRATYPIRVGTHGSTAFALILFARYAPFAEQAGLAELLRATALRWYGADADCQAWEPSGADFLSPALVEAACMAELLPPEDFGPWLARFLPRLGDGEPATVFSPASVSDRSDGQIAHLDGLSFSRAWCFRHLAEAAPEPLRERLLQAAETHLDVALPHLADDYMGEHWLASFALLALDE